jgi:hypothetical protein
MNWEKFLPLQFFGIVYMGLKQILLERFGEFTSSRAFLGGKLCGLLKISALYPSSLYILF